MDELIAMVQNGGRLVWLLGVGTARLTPVFMIVPFLGRSNLGTLARGSIVLALAFFLNPWLDATAPAEIPARGVLYALIAKEVLLGTLFGVLSCLVFEIAAGVGFIIDNQRGLSMAQTHDPISGEETSPLGSLGMETLVMVFVAGGGLILFFDAVLASFVFWPPFSFWPDWSAKPVKNLLLGQFGWYLTTLVVLAAPMLMVCFLVDLGMGLMNRFAPQLNVFFLSMPIKSALSMLLLLVYWQSMFVFLSDELLRLPAVWDALRGAFSAS